MPRDRKEPGHRHVHELRESVKENGILNPILVTRSIGDKYRLVDGLTRLRIAEDLGLEVPIICRDE